MLLPGGIHAQGEVRREAAFRPLTGELELSLLENRSGEKSIPAQVTAVLTSALERLGNEKATREMVGELSVGDRQFLMRNLAAVVGGDQVWLSVACQECSETIDFPITQTDLPVKRSGEGFPFAALPTDQGEVTIRVPNGNDQEAIADYLDDGEAQEHLLSRILMEQECEAAGIDRLAALGALDFEDISNAIEHVAPEVALHAVACCPHCQEENLVHVDPYLLLQQHQDVLLDDIHLLASTYHWDEATILAMPSRRRREYARLIDRRRGVAR